jgi:hypothetical protein
MITINKKILIRNFFCFQNWLGLVIFIPKYEIISAQASAHTNEKREKVI